MDDKSAGFWLYAALATFWLDEEENLPIRPLSAVLPPTPILRLSFFRVLAVIRGQKCEIDRQLDVETIL